MVTVVQPHAESVLEPVTSELTMRTLTSESVSAETPVEMLPSSPYTRSTASRRCRQQHVHHLPWDISAKHNRPRGSLCRSHSPVGMHICRWIVGEGSRGEG
jgi:hypothetical protein